MEKVYRKRKNSKIASPNAKIVKKQNNSQNKNEKVLPKIEIYDVLFKEKHPRTISDIILANLIVLSACTLAFFVPIVSFALPIFVFMFLSVGLWGFVLKKEENVPYKYEDIFVSVKKYVKIFCMFIVKVFLTIFGMICLVVPGILCALNYSFTGLILFEDSNLDVKSALLISKELVFGHRWTIFLYFLISVMSICAGATLMFFVIMFFDVFLEISSVIYIVFVVMASVLTLVCLALPMIEISVADCYILAKSQKNMA